MDEDAFNRMLVEYVANVRKIERLKSYLAWNYHAGLYHALALRRRGPYAHVSPYFFSADTSKPFSQMIQS